MHPHRSGEGAKQPEIFSHERAALLDDPERERWLPSNALLELINAPPRTRVLDFGSGTGRYAIALAQARPDLLVVGYDIQPEMLEIARRRTTERGIENLVAATWPEAQSYAPYERIVAIHLLHEIDDETLGRFAPLLAPAGVLLVVDWDATIERPVGPPANHAHTPDEALERLARSGLKRLERLNDERFPYHFIIRAWSSA
jgi:SAM-dependent methyltransferase